MQLTLRPGRDCKEEDPLGSILREQREICKHTGPRWAEETLCVPAVGSEHQMYYCMPETTAVDVRTENVLPAELVRTSDITGNSMKAPTRRRGGSAAARAFNISLMNQAPMLCPTRSTLVSGPYAVSSSSKSSRCACTCAERVTEEASGKKRLWPMKDKYKCAWAKMVTDEDLKEFASL